MRIFLLGGVLVLPAAGCATKGDLRELQTSIQRMEREQEEILSRIALTLDALQDSVSSQADVVFGLRGDVNQQLLDMQEQLITLQELTGQSQRNLAAIRDQFESQRNRLALPPSRGDPEAGGGGDEARPEGPGAGGPGAASGGRAEELYNAAVSQFNRGSFSTSRRAFEQFLQAYPAHSLAPGAHYYLAEILVQEGRYQEAIDGFLRIPEMFPRASRVPDALYRVGVLHLQELDDPEGARRFLERVVNSYPDAGVANLARERLREIN